MAIEYNKTNWVNNITKLNATNMNHIEDGIEAVTNAVNSVADIPISEGTGTNSLVVNDIETNTAISDNVASFGTGNIGGLKGYYWSAIDFTTKTITVSESHAGGASVNCEYSVDDKISIVNGSKYDECSTITAINNNLVTVDKLPFSGVSTVEWGGYFEFVIYCSAKPEIGVVDLGKNAFATGENNAAVNRSAFAAGYGNKVIGQYGVAVGKNNKAAYACFVSGRNNSALWEYGNVEGFSNVANSMITHIEGRDNETLGGEGLHVEGQNNTASGQYNHTEGQGNATSGTNAHTQGSGNTNKGNQSFVGGSNNQLNSGGYSFVHGTDNVVTGARQFVFGKGNKVSNDASNGDCIVGGWSNDVNGGVLQTVIGNGNTVSSGNIQCVFGKNIKVTSGYVNSAFGLNHTITGFYSHTTGKNNTNTHEASSVHGIGNKSGRTAQTVVGQYNVQDSNMMFVVGGGDSDSSRKNLFAVSKDGLITSEGSTTIAAAAYRGTKYKCVIIPDGVTSIGNQAFASCTELTSITMPDSVTSLGIYTFVGCRSLKSITIPDSVTSIGNYTFWNCTSLMSVTIPDSVKSIDEAAFSGCTGLTNITIPASVTSIGQSAFYRCPLKVIDLTAYTTQSFPTLDSNNFNSITSDCQIKVVKGRKSELVSMTNWSAYADHVVEVPTVETLQKEIDELKAQLLALTGE